MSDKPVEYRFPQPDFTVEYRFPDLKLPGPSSFLWAYADILVLVAIMALTALAFYRWRSRIASVACSLAGLLWFGLFRQGCPCPVGTVQDVIALAINPAAVIDFAELIFFLLPLVAALFWGRLYCGGACPLGAVQELLFLRKLSIPSPLAATLGTVPVFVLGVIVAAAWTGAPNAACRTDPFLPVFHPGGISGRWLLSASFLAVSLLVYRPYCRFFCVYGLMQKLASKLSGNGPSISPDSCLGCGVCSDTCPADAIDKPDNPTDTEEGRSRIIPLAAVSLGLVVAFAFLGHFLGRSLSALHPDVVLASLFARGNTDALEVRTFLERSGDVAALAAHAREIVSRFSLVMTVTGALAALRLGLTLAGTEFRRRRERREIRVDSCFACSRCIHNCPRERHSRNARKETV